MNRGAQQLLRRTPTSYRDELYAARRVVIGSGTSLGMAIARLREMMEREGIPKEVRSRRFFIAPCEQRNQIKWIRRQGAFRKLVAGHIQRIIEIEESLKH